jgi:hypothetical protein
LCVLIVTLVEPVHGRLPDPHADGGGLVRGIGRRVASVDT